MARSSSKVFFPWERRRGLFGMASRARVRLVVGIALALAFVIWIRGREERAAGVRATRANITTATNAIASYRADHGGKCPPTLDELVHGGYARDVPTDAWGHALRLTCPGRRDPAGFDLESDGPDGVSGGLDRVD
ncbi:MAG: type II secretion system protein GspG [Polyangiaceae bacterium]